MSSLLGDVNASVCQVIVTEKKKKKMQKEKDNDNNQKMRSAIGH